MGNIVHSRHRQGSAVTGVNVTFEPFVSGTEQFVIQILIHFR